MLPFTVMLSLASTFTNGTRLRAVSRLVDCAAWSFDRSYSKPLCVILIRRFRPTTDTSPNTLALAESFMCSVLSASSVMFSL